MPDLGTRPEPAFVLLAEVSDPAVARVVAARLESEGITVRLRGEWLGPYPVTVGSMANTQLWVPPDRLEEARMVLTAAEVDDALGRVEEDEADHQPWVWPLMAAVLLLVAILWLAARVG